MRVSHIACLFLALSLAACAQPQRAALADWEHGARRARVIEPVDPALVRAQLPSCLQAMPADELAARHFVRVRYWHGRRPIVEVAEAPTDVALHAGDEVELWPEACAEGRPARIARMLAAANQ